MFPQLQQFLKVRPSTSQSFRKLGVKLAICPDTAAQVLHRVTSDDVPAIPIVKVYVDVGLYELELFCMKFKTVLHSNTSDCVEQMLQFRLGRTNQKRVVCIQ